MPPKSKFSVEDIVDAAYRCVQKHGIEKLSARVIAEELSCSTMPIYSVGTTMQEIEEGVLKRIWLKLYEAQCVTRSGDVYLDMGLGYVMFARTEPMLFKFLHGSRHMDFNTRYKQDNFFKNYKRLEDYPLFKGVPSETVMKIMANGWIFSHGFADLLGASLSRIDPGLNTEQGIIDYFLEAHAMYWKGIERIVAEAAT
jgi:AcrR family transcriptional regulator